MGVPRGGKRDADTQVTIAVGKPFFMGICGDFYATAVVRFSGSRPVG